MEVNRGFAMMRKEKTSRGKSSMEPTVINAVSKYRQTDDILKKMTEKALGKKISHFTAKELAGGLCNAVYLLEAEQQKFVIKIAPAPEVKIMRHEKNILNTEANMLKLLEEKTTVRAPRLLAYDESCTLCNSPYMIMTFMEGTSLATMNPRPEEQSIGQMRRDIGRFCLEMSKLKAKQFGIPAMPETYREENCDFVLLLFQMLLQDAKEKGIEIPAVTGEELLSMIESQRQILNEAKEPCYVHTDTWDGNLMVKDNTLVGLVDFAAILYGDPLMNHDFHDFSEEPRKEFLEGFEKTSFTKHEKIRICIYKLWQQLGMIVERGYRGYDDPSTYAWVLDIFKEEIAHFRKLVS